MILFPSISTETIVMFLFSLLAGAQMLFHRLFLREFRYKVVALDTVAVFFVYHIPASLSKERRSHRT